MTVQDENAVVEKSGLSVKMYLQCVGLFALNVKESVYSTKYSLALSQELETGPKNGMGLENTHKHHILLTFEFGAKGL